MRIYKSTTLVMAAACTLCAVMIAADNNPDESFVKSAAQGGMAEVQLGHLAEQKAGNSKVRAFGQRMVTDHSKANDELKSIAEKKGITLPTDLSAKDQALKTRLEGLSGDAFDKAYMSSMVKDHETDIAEFQKEADSGRDPDFKAFAAKTLPILQEHLRLAKDAATAVGATQ